MRVECKAVENPFMSSLGFLYIAYGDRCANECLRSIRSARQFTSLPIKVFTDRVGVFSSMDAKTCVEELTPECEIDPRERKRIKVELISKSPFNHTIFMDTDTLFASDPTAMFDILQGYPLGVAHAPIRESCNPRSIPNWFPEFNTGVICYRRDRSVADLFDRWLWQFDELGLSRDQPAFRIALYESGLKFVCLPPEFNLRSAMPWFIGGKGKPVIIHGRNPLARRMSRNVKLAASPRVGIPWAWRLRRVKNTMLKMRSLNR